MKKSLLQRIEELESIRWLRYSSSAAAGTLALYFVGFSFLLLLVLMFGSGMLGVYLGLYVGDTLAAWFSVAGSVIAERTKVGLATFLFVNFPWIVAAIANSHFGYGIELHGFWIQIIGSSLGSVGFAFLAVGSGEKAD